MPRFDGGKSLTDLSAMIISPSVIVSKPAIKRSNVDFPHPDGPTKTTNSPFVISRSTSRMTLTFPNALLTLFNSTCAIYISSNDAVKVLKSKQHRNVCVSDMRSKIICESSPESSDI